MAAPMTIVGAQREWGKQQFPEWWLRLNQDYVRPKEYCYWVKESNLKREQSLAFLRNGSFNNLKQKYLDGTLSRLI